MNTNFDDDEAYYRARLQEELDHRHTTLQHIRSLAWESLVAFIQEIAYRIGLSYERFIEMFGPFGEISGNTDLPGDPTGPGPELRPHKPFHF